MKEEKMYVPSGLKTVDGKDIMCYTGAFYLKNKEKIDKMLKKCEEILREEERKSKKFKGKNENIIREETEKYYINQKHDKIFKEMLSDKKRIAIFPVFFVNYSLFFFVHVIRPSQTLNSGASACNLLVSVC